MDGGMRKGKQKCQGLIRDVWQRGYLSKPPFPNTNTYYAVAHALSILASQLIRWR